MPACPAVTSAPIMLHVAPHGYAAHATSSSLVTSGVLSLTPARLAGTSNTAADRAQGSAAGRGRPTRRGDGSAAVPQRPPAGGAAARPPPARGCPPRVAAAGASVASLALAYATGRVRGPVMMRL